MSVSTATWEAAIVARIKAGDNYALAAVYDRYASLVHRIAAQVAGFDHAGDVSQEVFTTLWQHPERFDVDRGSLRTYLAMITRRRSVDTVRRTNRRKTRERRVGNETISTSPLVNVEEAAAVTMTAQRVRSALDQLPAEQQTAIKLAYLDGLTYRAVATALGIPEGTAKSRLRSGLARLANELTDLHPNQVTDTAPARRHQARAFNPNQPPSQRVRSEGFEGGYSTVTR